MTLNLVFSRLKERSRSIDWKLLVFLVLVLNVKMAVKVAAIVLVCLWRRDLRFGFRFTSSRLPIFYLLVIGIAIFNWLVYGLVVREHYNPAFATGLFIWVLCILSIHQVRLFTEQIDTETLHRTILLFFILNTLLSLGVYAGIILETGHINPYRYQGNYQKYFIGTGDYIKGISFDTSTTNAFLNAFGVLYFLNRGKTAWVLICMLVLLLTGSNVTNLILACVFLYLFLFQSDKVQKSLMVVCLMMLAIFMLKVSPQNNKYVKKAWTRLVTGRPPEREMPEKFVRITERPDSTLTDDEKKEKTAQLYLDSMNRERIEREKAVRQTPMAPVLPASYIQKPTIPKDSIHTPSFQHKYDTTPGEMNLISFIHSRKEEVPIAASRKLNDRLPGKLIAWKQTIRFFQQHPVQAITGTGMGNFSSKLAFRTTGMNIAGGYPKNYLYMNKAFESNHLDLYLYYYTDKDDLHSIANSPNSTIDQLFSEYGVAGLIAFTFFYLVYFFSRIKKGGYGLPILLMMLGGFFMEYWFEQLSVVIFFELLLFLNSKETVNPNNHAHP